MYNKTFSFPFSVVRNDEELDLTITGTYFYDPGRYYGPPEVCYPSDEDISYTVTLNDKDWEGTLSEDEQKDLQDLITQNLEEPYEDEHDYEND